MERHERIESMATPRKNNEPGRNGFRYRPQYGVVVICENETHQEQVYAQLRRNGYVCKVVAV